MFNIGFPELIIILLVAVVVVGPERLPDLARKAGQMINDFRRMYAKLRSELGPDFDEIEKQIRTLRSLDPRQELNSVGRRLVDGLTEEAPDVFGKDEGSLASELARLQATIKSPYGQVPMETHNTIAPPTTVQPPTADVPVVDAMEKQSIVGRLGRDLLDDQVLDEPMNSDSSIHFEG